MGHSSSAPPIIDIEPLRFAPGGSDAAECAAAMHSACLDTGFFVVTGHGLDEELINLLDLARRFFEQPQAAKERIPRIERYGFVPHKDSAIDLSRASDNTEYLDLGLHQEVDPPDITGFEDAVRSHQQAALDVAAAILRALAIALGAEPDFFSTRMVDPQCRLRFLHYPEIEPGVDGSLPVPNLPHTDYGLITLLATDGVPGLEVKPIDSGWTPVAAPAGSLVINLGDMLARWSNDIYRSTPHRVVGPELGDRLSIPFFINPDPRTIVGCIPSCVSIRRPCAYVPVTAGEFLAARIDAPAEPYIDPHEGPVRRVTG